VLLGYLQVSAVRVKGLAFVVSGWIIWACSVLAGCLVLSDYLQVSVVRIKGLAT
jgi:hypothetical protein